MLKTVYQFNILTQRIKEINTRLKIITLISVVAKTRVFWSYFDITLLKRHWSNCKYIYNAHFTLQSNLSSHDLMQKSYKPFIIFTIPQKAVLPLPKFPTIRNLFRMHQLSKSLQIPPSYICTKNDVKSHTTNYIWELHNFILWHNYLILLRTQSGLSIIVLFTIRLHIIVLFITPLSIIVYNCLLSFLAIILSLFFFTINSLLKYIHTQLITSKVLANFFQFLSI